MNSLNRPCRPALSLPGLLLSAAGLSLAALGMFGTAQAQESSFTQCRSIDTDAARLACYDRLADSLLGVPEETRAEAMAQESTEVARAAPEPMPAPTPTEEETAVAAAAPPAQTAPMTGAPAQPAATATVQRDQLAREDNLARRLKEQESAFGAEDISRENKKEKDLDELTQPITAFRILPRGNVRLVLDNGQVWDQLESDRRELQRIDDRWLQTATISRAAFGSYRMKVEPLGDTIKVKRVK